MAVTTLIALTVLGGQGASADGAGVLKGEVRVTFWGALAMSATAAVGMVFGVTALGRRWLRKRHAKQGRDGQGRHQRPGVVDGLNQGRLFDERSQELDGGGVDRPGRAVREHVERDTPINSAVAVSPDWRCSTIRSPCCGARG
jgi:hypothetical protein